MISVERESHPYLNDQTPFPSQDLTVSMNEHEEIEIPISIESIHRFINELCIFKKDPANKGKKFDHPIGKVLRQKEHHLDEEQLQEAKQYVLEYEKDIEIANRVNGILNDTYSVRSEKRGKSRNKKGKSARERIAAGEGTKDDIELIKHRNKSKNRKRGDATKRIAIGEGTEDDIALIKHLNAQRHKKEKGARERIAIGEGTEDDIALIKPINEQIKHINKKSIRRKKMLKKELQLEKELRMI
jgi:hypothetical protein